MDNQNTTNNKQGISLITQQMILPGAIKGNLLSPNNPQKGDLYYLRDGVNFINLPIGTLGKTLTVVGGLPAWQAPVTIVTATSGADFTTSSGTYIDSSQTTSSVTIAPIVISNILILTTIFSNNDTDSAFYTLGIGKGVNTSIITGQSGTIAQNQLITTTLTYMDLSVAQGTYTYHMGCFNSGGGKTIRIKAGSIITAIATPV